MNKICGLRILIDMNFSNLEDAMSILNFPNKKTKKHLPQYPFDMQKHLSEFSKEVTKYATYSPEHNPLYKEFKKKMKHAKNK